MFVKNNNILICWDDLGGMKYVLKQMEAVCFFIQTWNLASLFLSISSQDEVLQLSCSPFGPCYVLLVWLKIAQEESVLTEQFLFQTTESFKTVLNHL